jgi:hypothetical protein
MAAKSSPKKIRRLEGICVGAGFLLKKLNASFGAEFGEGMRQQIRDCIKDCDAVGRAMQQREAAEKAAAEKATGGGA